MDNSSARVLKADNVTFEGQVQLDVKNKINQRPKAAAPMASAQARITEKCAEYVVIEASCTCGRKMLIKCVYENN